MSDDLALAILILLVMSVIVAAWYARPSEWMSEVVIRARYDGALERLGEAFVAHTEQVLIQNEELYLATEQLKVDQQRMKILMARIANKRWS